MLVAALAVLLGLLVKLESREWVILVLTIAGVLTLELINTSLEAIVNMISPGQSTGAKIAKDTAAAAVVIGAITSVVIGLILFVPKLIR